jgi:hypothetical protein
MAKLNSEWILIVRINGYAHLVPYVEAGDQLFLNTIIPSRKSQRHYNNDPSPGESDALDNIYNPARRRGTAAARRFRA